MPECTTLLVHKETRDKLSSLKEYARESYDEVINKLVVVYEKLQAESELSEGAKKDVEAARAQIKAGRKITTKQLMAELGL